MTVTGSDWQQPAKQRQGASRTPIVVMGLILVVAIGTTAMAALRATPQQRTYIDEYGGSSQVYADIAAASSCGQLQTMFDTAAANNDRATPGTTEHKYTTGYMTAAVDRMKTLGCP